MVLNTTHKLQVCWWKGRVTRKCCGRASDGSALLRGLAAEARCEHGAAETLHPCVQLAAVHDACERDAGVWRTQRWTTSWGSQWGQSLRILQRFVSYKSNNTNLQKKFNAKKVLYFYTRLRLLYYFISAYYLTHIITSNGIVEICFTTKEEIFVWVLS